MRAPHLDEALGQHLPSGTSLIIRLWESEFVDGLVEDGRDARIEAAVVYQGDELDLFCVVLPEFMYVLDCLLKRYGLWRLLVRGEESFKRDTGPASGLQSRAKSG